MTQGNPGRIFSESYIALTDFGYNAKIPQDGIGGKATASSDKVYLSCFGGKPENVPNPDRVGYSADEYAGKGIINWLHVSSACAMLPPYSYGSTSSRLMDYLEPSHYGVQLTDEEKRAVACWIDLNVPYCGSWMELNFWDKLNHATHSGLTPWYVYRGKMRQIYLYFEAKRLRAAELETDAIAKFIEHTDTGKAFAPSDFPAFDLGGKAAQAKFVADYDNLPNTVPIFGLAEGRAARGGSNVSGNPVRNLALNPDAYTYWLRSYPRAAANSHSKYLPQCSPVCAIDGKRDGGGWRPDRRTDLLAQRRIRPQDHRAEGRPDAGPGPWTERHVDLRHAGILERREAGHRAPLHRGAADLHLPGQDLFVGEADEPETGLPAHGQRRL